MDGIEPPAPPPPRPAGPKPHDIRMGCCLVFGLGSVAFMVIYLGGHLLAAFLRAHA